MRAIAVVGAGAAGLAAIETLRHEGFDGRLVLIGDEPLPPYDRPPLSKQVLSGVWDTGRISLREPAHYRSLDVELITGRRATGMTQRDPREVVLDNGDRVGFDGLIIATGVAPKRLRTGHDLVGVHVLRDVEDATRLREAFASRPRLVIVGAGFLGAESAAVARASGLEVTLVDPLPVPMIRQVGTEIGGYLADLHARNGVRLRTGLGVDGFVADEGRVTGVRLTDGSVEAADCVLVAIGAVPNTDWLAASGLHLGDGVEGDAYCRAAMGVYAAGDVASWLHLGYGRRLRLEHRMNAAEHGAAAARNLLLGDVEPFRPVPYFWTDQYDVKIQVHGFVPPDAEIHMAEGDPSEGRFTVLYRQSGRIRGVLTWNNPKSARRYRQELVAAGDSTRSGGDSD
jgi:3-phenylpropionate/trans-cinnamate dioxygenase ferredoxin reductase component